MKYTEYFVTVYGNRIFNCNIAIFLLVLLKICCQIVVCIFYDLNYIIIFVFL